MRHQHFLIHIRPLCAILSNEEFPPSISTDHGVLIFQLLIIFLPSLISVGRRNRISIASSRKLRPQHPGYHRHHSIVDLLLYFPCDKKKHFRRASNISLPIATQLWRAMTSMRYLDRPRLTKDVSYLLYKSWTIWITTQGYSVNLVEFVLVTFRQFLVQYWMSVRLHLLWPSCIKT